MDHHQRNENEIVKDSGDFKTSFPNERNHPESPDVQEQNQVAEQRLKVPQKSKRPIQSRRQKPFTRKFPRKIKNPVANSQNSRDHNPSLELSFKNDQIPNHEDEKVFEIQVKL